jgi:hypothetical protein
MNCEAFDKDIRATFEHYGKLGVHVQLYAVNDQPTPTPPGDWISVTVVVTPALFSPIPHTDTWYYGGAISHTSHPGAPLGVLPIDPSRLVGACKAASVLPSQYPVDLASCNLHWPLVPGSQEPTYTFVAPVNVTEVMLIVGAYSGKLLNGYPPAEAETAVGAAVA